MRSWKDKKKLLIVLRLKPSRGYNLGLDEQTVFKPSETPTQQ